MWNPVIGESLLVTRESTNSNAMAVHNNNLIIGHVPYNLAQSISNFLKQDMNKAFAKVTRMEVNRGAGYGLEVPCKY